MFPGASRSKCRNCAFRKSYLKYKTLLCGTKKIAGLFEQSVTLAYTGTYRTALDYSAIRDPLGGRGEGEILPLAIFRTVGRIQTETTTVKSSQQG